MPGIRDKKKIDILITLHLSSVLPPCEEQREVPWGLRFQMKGEGPPTVRCAQMCLQCPPCPRTTFQGIAPAHAYPQLWLTRGGALPAVQVDLKEGRKFRGTVRVTALEAGPLKHWDLTLRLHPGTLLPHQQGSGRVTVNYNWKSCKMQALSEEEYSGKSYEASGT